MKYYLSVSSYEIGEIILFGGHILQTSYRQNLYLSRLVSYLQK